MRIESMLDCVCLCLWVYVCVSGYVFMCFVCGVWIQWTSALRCPAQLVFSPQGSLNHYCYSQWITFQKFVNLFPSIKGLVTNEHTHPVLCMSEKELMFLEKASCFL